MIVRMILFGVGRPARQGATGKLELVQA